MVLCKKCKKETNVTCLCGICPACNGDDLFNDDFKDWLAKEKQKLITNKVKQ